MSFSSNILKVFQDALFLRVSSGWFRVCTCWGEWGIRGGIFLRCSFAVWSSFSIFLDFSRKWEANMSQFGCELGPNVEALAC